MSAAVDLVRRVGGEVLECAFIIELSFLGGKARLAPVPMFSLIKYEAP